MPERPAARRIHAVKWRPDEWQQIERAVAALNRQSGLGSAVKSVTPTDVIRAGTLELCAKLARQRNS